MAVSDVFIFLDDAQMPGGQSFVYRNRIRDGENEMWLSVPKSCKFGDRINAVKFSNQTWSRKHLATLQMNYARTPFYNEIMSIITPIYQMPGDTLSNFNIRLIQTIAAYLSLNCKTFIASDLQINGVREDRLIRLVKSVNGDVYISGSGGTKYQHPERFEESGIDLIIYKYQQIEYIQSQGRFLPNLSILDALFHLGRSATKLLVLNGENVTTFA